MARLQNLALLLDAMSNELKTTMRSHGAEDAFLLVAAVLCCNHDHLSGRFAEVLHGGGRDFSRSSSDPSNTGI